MLNGKFYTGLTANQMNRSRGPDRQKSSFFWPDETDTVPSPNNRSGRRPAVTKSAPSVAKSVATPATDEKDHHSAKDMFHQQLSSKIGFYDDPTPASKSLETRRVARPNPSKIAELSTLRQDISDIAEQIDKPRRGTTESKIEFYDFPEKSISRRTEKPVPKETKVVPSTKKITFHEPVKRGILKNNEVSSRHPIAVEQFAVDQIPTYKKNITPTRRIQLSKSVDNMARLAKAEPKSKRNNVEQSAARQKFEQSRLADDYDDDDYEPVNVNTKPSFRSYQEEHQDEETENGRKLQHFVQEEAHDDWTDRNGQHVSHSQRSKQHSHQQHSTVVNNTGRYHSEDYQTKNHNIEVQRFEEHRSTSSPPPSPNVVNHPVTHFRSSNDDVGYAKHYAHVTEAPNTGRRSGNASNSSSASQHGVQPAAAGRSTQPNNKVYPNEAAVRAQSHLRSNIFFNDTSSHVDEDRPRSVRESAVSRVGVGLPNI